MKVLLTGATGYFGSQLMQALTNQNYEVHIMVRNAQKRNLQVAEMVKIFEGDICDYNSIVKAAQDCSYIFHTAAFTNLKCSKIDPFYEANVNGTENILKAAKELGVRRVIYTSTLAVFGPSYNNTPINEKQVRVSTFQTDYELTKFMSEEIVRRYVQNGLDVIILNLSRIYGPGRDCFSNGINSLIKLIQKKQILFVPNKLDVAFNYVFIEDAVRAHISAMKGGVAGENYIVGGENIDYKDLFQKIVSQLKKRISIIPINYKMAKFCVALLSFVQKVFGIQNSITPTMLDALFTERICSSEKATVELGYSITPFELGLKQTINQLNLKL